MSQSKIVVSRAQVGEAIAEHVFGWKRHVCVLPNGSFDCWLLPPVEGTPGQVIKMLDDVMGYSCHMGAAWKVVDELRRRWTEATEKSNGVDDDFAHPFDDQVFFESIRSDVQRRWPWTFLYATPMNICIAALESLGIEVSE